MGCARFPKTRLHLFHLTTVTHQDLDKEMSSAPTSAVALGLIGNRTGAAAQRWRRYLPSGVYCVRMVWGRFRPSLSAEAGGSAAAGSQRCRKGEELGDAREGRPSAANVDDGVPKRRKCLLMGVRRRRVEETLWVSRWERRQLRLCALYCASMLVHSSADGRSMLIYAESLLSILWCDRIRSGRWGPRCLQTFLLSL